jgi:hypothetical protein
MEVFLQEPWVLARKHWIPPWIYMLLAQIRMLLIWIYMLLERIYSSYC